jgi:alpha-D-ribose 1-methylphosphonate 5-triphosphate synthase subunit PhnL
MSTVITVENLGKKYTLHHQQRKQYTAMRDVPLLIVGTVWLVIVGWSVYGK